MKDKVESYIAGHQLLQKDRTVIVALSGGADSVALLCILQEMGYDILALHCNFHLRGEESDRDEDFVTKLCQAKGIRLIVKHFNTLLYCQQHGVSIEMAARELRYSWFQEEAERNQAQGIAVAHHKDDQAETLLLNLTRGCGLQGLSGMKPKRDNILRPFLCVTRKEILEYLQSLHQDYVTDSTNLEREAQRNILRMDVIPLLADINPKITETVSETCNILQQSMLLYKKGVEAEFCRLGITERKFPIKILDTEETAPTLLFEWLKGKNFSRTLIGGISDSYRTLVGKIWESPTHRVLRDRESLIIQKKNITHPSAELREEIVTEITSVGSNIAYFDADLITMPIHVRKVEKGDWFVPFGMKGRKLVSDFLTDLKLSRFQKQEQEVALVGEDIIWVIGRRSDNRYRVTDRTRRILRLTLET